MAQDFERTITSNIDTSFVNIRAASNSDDALVGIRLVNVSDTTSITVDVKIVNNNDSDALLGYIIKNAPIPAAILSTIPKIIISLNVKPNVPDAYMAPKAKIVTKPSL